MGMKVVYATSHAKIVIHKNNLDRKMCTPGTCGYTNGDMVN